MPSAAATPVQELGSGSQLHAQDGHRRGKPHSPGWSSDGLTALYRTCSSFTGTDTIPSLEASGQWEWIITISSLTSSSVSRAGSRR